MRFENLDSMLPPDVPTIERVCASSGHSLSALRKAPVYWVSEALMDKLYDPWRTVLLNPDCVDKALEGAGEKIDPEKSGEDFIRDLDRFWDRLAECSGKAKTVYRPAMGVYIQAVDEAAVKHIESARRKSGKSVSGIVTGMSAVFVCPERCAARIEGLETSLSESNCVELSTAQVIFHELAHAWLDTDLARYRTPWGRLIEESLCEAESSLDFDSGEGKSERAIINRLLLDGPIEYRAFRFWNRFMRGPMHYRRSFDFDSMKATDLWKRFTYESLFEDVSSLDSVWEVDSLFSGDFGDFTKANRSLPKEHLVEIFWKQVARRILVWIHEEEA